LATRSRRRSGQRGELRSPGATPTPVVACGSVWAIGELAALIRVDRLLGDRCAELAHRHGSSAYDAAYVAGAERVGAPLASCDECDLVSRGLARLPRDLLG
jgi:hypothetical protein